MSAPFLPAALPAAWPTLCDALGYISRQEWSQKVQCYQLLLLLQLLHSLQDGHVSTAKATSWQRGQVHHSLTSHQRAGGSDQATTQLVVLLVVFHFECAQIHLPLSGSRCKALLQNSNFEFHKQHLRWTEVFVKWSSDRSSRAYQRQQMQATDMSANAAAWLHLCLWAINPAVPESPQCHLKPDLVICRHTSATKTQHPHNLTVK